VTNVSARPEVAVGAVVVEDGRLLMIRRGRPPGLGRWSVPGGRVEFGETLAEAVVREVLEETGLEVLCGPLLGWKESIEPGHHLLIFDFVADAIDLVDPVAGDDAVEVAWVPLDDVAERDLVEGLAEFLHEHGILDTIV
jgi:8-oxo-dGTP diphosphatase